LKARNLKRLPSYLFLLILVLFFYRCEEEPEITSVYVIPNSTTIFKGETQQFFVNVEDQYGDVMKNVEITWISDNESVAIVDENGLATGVGDGITIITAESDGERGSATLTVELTIEQQLINTWKTISGEAKLILTTNSNQTAFDLFSKGKGVIQVTGGFPADLTYLYGFSNEESGSFFTVTVFPIFTMFDTALPALVILDIPPSVSIMTFGMENISGDTLQYSASPAAYSYDKQIGSLTIPTVVLYDDGESDSVTINGTLAYSAISLPEFTPTAIDFPMFEMKDGQMSVTFDEGGIFSRTISQTSDGEVTTETSEGTWELLSDSTIKIIETFENRPFSEPDTQIVYITLNEEGRLNLQFEEDACRYEKEECLREFETLLNLENGSLDSILHREVFEMVEFHPLL